MFFAYKSSPNGTEFRFDGREESQGSLGSFAPGDSLPVSQAETIEELEAQAYALLGKEPDWLLYLTDDQLRVHQILINRKHHKILEKSQDRATKRLVLLVLCCLSLMASSTTPRDRLIFGAFLISATVYVVLFSGVSYWRTFDGIVACVILLILMLLAINSWTPTGETHLGSISWESLSIRKQPCRHTRSNLPNVRSSLFFSRLQPESLKTLPTCCELVYGC